MKKLLAAEEIAQLVLCMYLYFQLPQHLGITLFIPVFFYPDLFAIGFLINNRIGTILYNFSHHKLVALTLVVSGYFISNNFLLQAGIIAYAHTCFDRTIGYGLKYLGNPDKTHLGFIGKSKANNPPDSF